MGWFRGEYGSCPVSGEKWEEGSFSVRPVMRFAAKGEQLQEGQNFAVDRKCIMSNGVILSYGTNGELQMEKERIWRDLFLSRMRGMEEMASEVLS